MTPEEWKRHVGRVTDRMKEFTRPYVTPLRTSDNRRVRLLGTGSYLTVKERSLLLTCEHVIRNRTAEYQFWGSDRVYPVIDPFTYDKFQDIAFALIPDGDWIAGNHGARTISFDGFAPVHQPIEHELLFFRGFAGENAHYGFGVHEANATAYCSQQSLEKPIEPEVFEILWVPEEIEFSRETSDEMRSTIRHDDPRGLSGSLVWNTRYVEQTSAGKDWRPEDAVITGLLRWHIPERKTVAALRVEHLRSWLLSRI
jgi:hypothetical protein